MSYERHLIRNFGSAALRTKVIAIVVAVGIVASLVFFAFTHPLLLKSSTGQHVLEVFFAALASMTRLAIAFSLSLILAVGAACLVTTFRRAESVLMPVFDILQSVPVLAFFPAAVVLFARFKFYEGAALFVLLTAMLWPLLFSLVGAIRAIPRDVQDAARIFGARGLRYWRFLILPACFPGLVTGSILAFAAGWNVVIVAEFINYGGFQLSLPGLGSILDRATQQNPPDTTLFLISLAVMVTIIIAVNRLVWHPLALAAEQYKFD
jgi:NitT/TauT family transport system permease protein